MGINLTRCGEKWCLKPTKLWHLLQDRMCYIKGPCVSLLPQSPYKPMFLVLKPPQLIKLITQDYLILASPASWVKAKGTELAWLFAKGKKGIWPTIINRKSPVSPAERYNMYKQLCGVHESPGKMNTCVTISRQFNSKTVKMFVLFLPPQNTWKAWPLWGQIWNIFQHSTINMSMKHLKRLCKLQDHIYVFGFQRHTQTLPCYQLLHNFPQKKTIHAGNHCSPFYWLFWTDSVPFYFLFYSHRLSDMFFGHMRVSENLATCEQYKTVHNTK